MQAQMKIAVAEATGRVGSHVVKVLEARGHAVVAMSRSSGWPIWRPTPSRSVQRPRRSPVRGRRAWPARCSRSGSRADDFGGCRGSTRHRVT